MFLFPFTGMSKELDLVFAVDGSKWVDEYTFTKMKNFVKGSLDIYTISPQKTRIGLVTYGGDARDTALSLPLGTSKQAAERSIDSLVRVGGLREMNKAIRFVDTEIFSGKGGTRPRAGKALVLLTTGKNSANGKDDLPKTAKKLKDKGIEVFVIGIVKGVDPDELNVIASNQGNVANVPDKDDLPRIFGQLEKATGKLTGKHFLKSSDLIHSFRIV